MTKRIFRFMLLISTIVLVLGFAMTLWVLHNYFDKELQTELQQEAVYLETAVNLQGKEYLEKLPSSENRITLIEPDGTVVFDNSADAATMENHKTREEVAEAQEQGIGNSVRYSATLSEKTVYYAVQLDNKQILRISRTEYTVIALLAGLIQPLCYVVLVMLLLAGFSSYKLSRKVVEPINQLDLEHPSENAAYDEVAPLLTKIRTQQTEIQNQLKEAKRQQQEFEIITENMQEGLLVIDSHTIVLSCNKSALSLLGTKNQPSKESVFTLNRSSQFQELIEAVLSGNHTSTEAQFGGRDCEMIANPVFYEEKVQGAIVLLVDVTERMQRENLRREFTANVSHELKTPLTSISGFAEIIQEGYVKSSDVKKFAGNIFKESQRLITLVGDIIKISKLDEGTVLYQKEKVDVFDTVKDIFESLQSAAKAGKVHLYLDGEHCTEETVKPILTEVLYNICENAVKYNQKGGSVTVSVQEGPKGQTEVTVQDTGIGIPKEEQSRIFERFYRVDKSHSKAIGGTGLGLSIVKHGNAYLGLEMELESEVDHGTKVILRFPKKECDRSI